MLPAALEALRVATHATPRAKPLPLDLASLDDALPEGGLPRGAVIEIASARGLARVTTIALSAIASAQRLARDRSGDEATPGAWCAFVDPASSLHAPGLGVAGVDPERLLVVRPPPTSLARTAVKLVSARVFSVVVIDLVVPLGSQHLSPRGLERGGAFGPAARANDKLCNWVRRLSIANEKSDATVVLLTDSLDARALPLPVAMRIDVERWSHRRGRRSAAANENDATATTDPIWFRVTKERQGRVRPASRVELSKAAHLVRVAPGEPR